MSLISFVTYVVGILVLSVAHSHSNPMPQGTLPIRSEINVQDCSDEKHYPNVNITSGSFFKNVNSTTNLLKTHTPDVTLTCYTTYPVEWVFQELLSNEAADTIQERREWISSGKGRVQRYVIDLTFKLTSKIHNVTCRAATDGKECKQTTIKFIKGDTNGTKTTTASVHRGFPQGKLLQQYYDPNEGNNINCSIHLAYNKEVGKFQCDSQNKTGRLVLQESDKFKTELCYDSFSCGLLYNKPRTENCRKQLEDQKHGHDSGTTHSPFETEMLAGIVTCKSSAESENNVRGLEDSSTISASSHFFRPLPGSLCVGGQDLRRPIKHEIYVDLDPLTSLSKEQQSEFISLCGFGKQGNPLYAGDIQNVACYTSVYLFAEGVQMTVKMKNGSESNVTNIILTNAENPSRIKREGYRAYCADINISTTEINEINCSAPLRRSKTWISQTFPVEVLPPTDLQIVGATIENVRVKNGSDVYLKCLAHAEPKPQYEWKNLETDVKLPKEWVQVDSVDGGSRLTIPSQNWSLVPPTIVCIADNRLKYVRKTFTLQFTEGSDSNGNSWFAIVITIAVIVVGGIIGLLVWKILRQRRKLRLLSRAEIEEFMNGRPDVLNNSRSSSEYDVNSYAMCLPYNRNYEVLKEQLEIDVNAVIGSGAYGMVLKGILTTRNREKIQVAIKTLKPMDDISYFKALMSELKIMGFIGKHDNIVNLLGAYTKNLQNREIYIAIEFCDNGCMLNYMRSHRGSFVNHVVNGTLQDKLTRGSFSTQPQVLNTVTLLRWSMQIANGMDFLYHKKVIHGDLAARNILLSRNLTAKIGDFGLSRQLFEYANYIKKQQSPLPWKWLAIECLQDMKFSSQSDVWAYGVTLWEVFSLGHSPFPGCAYNEEFIDSLVAGKRPVRPQYATKELYNVMSKCWEINPSDRPSFAEITTFFDNTIRSITPEEYMDLESTSDTNLLLPIKMEGPRISINPPDDDSEGLPVDITRSPRNSKFRVSFMKNFKKF